MLLPLCTLLNCWSISSSKNVVLKITVLKLGLGETRIFHYGNIVTYCYRPTVDPSSWVGITIFFRNFGHDWKYSSIRCLIHFCMTFVIFDNERFWYKYSNAREKSNSKYVFEYTSRYLRNFQYLEYPTKRV